jgi:hypothetical protein
MSATKTKKTTKPKATRKAAKSTRNPMHNGSSRRHRPVEDSWKTGERVP